MKKFFILFLLTLTACSIQQKKSIEPVSEIQLDAFMGDWYVLAHIPALIEKNAFNAIESYKYIEEKQEIETTFTFNHSDYDGPQKIYKPKGYIVPGTNNAVWGMQFIWPIKAQYIIAYIDEGYQNTIVARDKRDYLWFMSRKSDMTTEKKQWIYKKTEELGYDKNMLRFVPHTL
ncbi:MAG: lipocalin family protein [Proteobacteria bacterium]|nr:lipocalin family protein [Pseudomonadota bacterium]MDA0942076.1 lipocalin family protein [Pseudomonadota bacterium]